jgi:hypothetical protein
MKKGLIAVFALALLLGSTVTPASARDYDHWYHHYGRWGGIGLGLGGLGLGLGLGGLGAGVYGGYRGYYTPYVSTYPAYGYGYGYYPSVEVYSAPAYYGSEGDYFF